MPVSSYVIRCHADVREAVLARLASEPGVTVGTATREGIPVAAETPSTDAARALGERLESLPGVLSATLVYHNFEDLESEPPRP